MKKQKRVAAIHDISCLGRCSLTVALPIISAAGIETSIIPTAVLSTHTGGFSGFTYRDLTEDIIPIMEHWQSLDRTYDAIYTGFLGSFTQLEIMSRFFKEFKTPDNIILVDPVMADNGVLYSIFSPDFVQGMKKLCALADIIVPNITEACFMLGEPYKEGPYTEEYIADLLKKLSGIGPKKVVLTGVFFDSDRLGASTYDSETGEITYVDSERVPGYFHGTGDVYGSALLSALIRGFNITDSAKIAVDFTVESILRTKEEGAEARYGVNFEESIPNFINNLSKNR